MQFTEHKVPTHKYYVSIDSRSRNTELCPNPNEYVVDFPNVFKNVVSVELVYAIYDKYATEFYVNLYIPELGPNLVSNCNQISGSFTQLPLLLPTNHYSSSMYKSIRAFEQPLAKLSRFSIRFMSQDGKLYDVKDHYLRFEIVCMKYESMVETNGMEVVSTSVPMMKPRKEIDSSTLVNNLVSDPYILLGLDKGCKDLPSIVSAFRYKTANIKLKSGTQWEYNKVKAAFKEIASKCKKG